MASAAEHFGRVLAEAAETTAAPPAVATPPRWRIVVDAVAESSALTALVVAAGSVVLLVLLRPPFVVRFERDAQRPWRGSASTCWLSVLTATALLVLFVTLAPLASSFL